LPSLLLSKNIKINTYRIIIFSFVFNGCETLSPTLREEHKLRVFEKRVLSRIFGPKRGEIIGNWRKLHNKELHCLYWSPSVIKLIRSRKMRWAGHVTLVEEKCKQCFNGETTREETTRKTWV
jgi:hypothetical protein